MVVALVGLRRVVLIIGVIADRSGKTKIQSFAADWFSLGIQQGKSNGRFFIFPGTTQIDEPGRRYCSSNGASCCGQVGDAVTEAVVSTPAAAAIMVSFPAQA